MQPILVAYTTNAGSTEDVARMIAEELGKDGRAVTIQRLEEVTTLEPYAAAVIGAPLIVGWHRAALNFVRRHQGELARMPVAYFFTAMNLTRTDQVMYEGIPLAVDPVAAQPPAHPGRLGIKENYALPVNYLKPALQAAPQVKPVSAGFFGGKLSMYTLKWYQALFVMLIIQAKTGGTHNKAFIREWAAELREKWSVDSGK